MEAALLLILVVAIAWLWRRVQALEEQVARLGSISAAPFEMDQRSQVSHPPESAVAADPIVHMADPGSPIAKARGWRLAFDFEDVFGRLLPVWAGGVTLAVAGFFLVRWSIDAGLLTPPVRVVLAAMFGLGLLGVAEAAYRWRERVADPRVSQALAGAGLATLYFAFYLAGTAYGLIGPALAFVLLAGVTAAAIALSFRFGLPSAVLGLVGGFAAPALVGSDDASLPLLTLYLALVTSGLSFTGRRQARPWMGIAALVGGLGWGALLVGGDAVRAPDMAVLGGYLVLLGGVIPAFGEPDGAWARRTRMAAGGLAALQLAVLVAQGGFGIFVWSFYLLLGSALAAFGWRDEGMRSGGAVVGAIAVLLLLSWPGPVPGQFAAIVFGLAVVFTGPGLARLWRSEGTGFDLGQVAGMAMGLAVATAWHFLEPLPGTPQPLAALALAVLAALPALAAHWAGRGDRNPSAWWVWGGQASAALIGFGALAQILPGQILAWVAALLSVAAAWRGATFAGALAMLASIALAWAIAPAGDWIEAALRASAGVPMMREDLPTVRAALLYLAPAALGIAAWRILAPPRPTLLHILAILAFSLTIILLHTAFRHGFGLLVGEDFTATGVVQRSVWQALMIATGWFAMIRGWRALAIAAVAAALAHFAWFSLGLHNPLWANQAVGASPVVNALVPMYGAGFAALWLAARVIPAKPVWLRWTIETATMVAIAFFAISELRQVFAGSLLTAGSVSQSEDLSRSILGIVLAVGFLLWGARSGRRSWRIGSLAAMLVAVLKVFLVDAAGLEGLARIGSFMALGFSLIGIGWFYNRQLRAADRVALAPPA